MPNNSHTSRCPTQRHPMEAPLLSPMKGGGLVCLCVAVAAMLTVSCNRTHDEVHFLRFERLLFDPGHCETPSMQFVSTLINYHPEDPQFVSMMNDFASDEVMQYVYHVTDSLYHDIGWLEKQLGKAMGKAEDVCPSMHYDRFYTLVTADFDDYHNRVFCSNNELAVSIDHYAVASMTRYGCFGTPAYILNLSSREHLVTDCMAAVARQHIVMPDGALTMLDYMIFEGKVQYFLEKTVPSAPDTIRLRYTANQLDWMQQATAKVWAWLVENKMLFSNDYSLLRNYIGDAPKTNAFGEGSAPRTTDYIGWQIVRRYAKRSGCTMEELFGETDSQKILAVSGWRPK